MELRQLRSLIALVEADFSVSRAADRLKLVQPAVSQHLRLLEDELGVPLFQRHGKRLLALTPVGEAILVHARASLAGAANILAIGRDQTGDTTGVLRIGTTHTQARYVLPPLMGRFRQRFSEVEIQLHQATPAQLVEMLLRDQVDIAICTEALGEHPDLSSSPCYRWNRCLIAPLDHPLLKVRPISLEGLCDQPLITYVQGFTGRGHFSDAFAREGLKLKVAVSATDTDIIKTYVRAGFGVGIIADLALDPRQDADLGVRDLSHLFPWEITRIALARAKYPRVFQRAFMDLFQSEAAALVRERQRRDRDGAGG